MSERDGIHCHGMQKRVTLCGALLRVKGVAIDEQVLVKMMVSGGQSVWMLMAFFPQKVRICVAYAVGVHNHDLSVANYNY